jgi:hypothetical protein
MTDLSVASAQISYLPYSAADGGAMYPPRGEAQTLVRQLGLTNSSAFYRRVLEWLKSDARIDVRYLRDLAKPVASGRIAVALRHDMDTEPYSSVEAARTLRDANLPGSFYVLHTAEYYGQWHGGVFRRSDGIAPMLREIQDECGCEIGLHTDGLWVFQKWTADGAQAIVEELAWLRKEGLRISGSAAHNSAPVYGGENFELFRGRSARHSCALPHLPPVPLQVLDERVLGLDYEANHPEIEIEGPSRLDEWTQLDVADPVRDERWMRFYLLEHPLCRWGSDFNLWLIGRDKWAIGGHRLRNGVFVWNAAFHGVAEFVERAPSGSRVVCHIHPIYIDFARA